jgi:hypothetical protein
MIYLENDTKWAILRQKIKMICNETDFTSLISTIPNLLPKINGRGG